MVWGRAPVGASASPRAAVRAGLGRRFSRPGLRRASVLHPGRKCSVLAGAREPASRGSAVFVAGLLRAFVCLCRVWISQRGVYRGEFSNVIVWRVIRFLLLVIVNEPTLPRATRGTEGSVGHHRWQTRPRGWICPRDLRVTLTSPGTAFHRSSLRIAGLVWGAQCGKIAPRLVSLLGTLASEILSWSVERKRYVGKHREKQPDARGPRWVTSCGAQGQADPVSGGGSQRWLRGAGAPAGT